MTRVIKNDAFIPVTLLEVPALKVVGMKTLEKDGYDAVIVGIVADETVKLGKDKTTLSKDAFDDIVEFEVSEGQTFEI